MKLINLFMNKRKYQKSNKEYEEMKECERTKEREKTKENLKKEILTEEEMETVISRFDILQYKAFRKESHSENKRDETILRKLIILKKLLKKSDEGNEKIRLSLDIIKHLYFT